MWMNFINTDVVKWIVDAGTALVGIVDKIGLIETAVIGLFGYLTFFKKADWTKGLGIFGGNKKMDLLSGTDLSNALNDLNRALADGPEALGKYVAGAKKAGNGMDVLAAKVSDGTIKMKNGKVSARDYTIALQQQSSAAQKAAMKQQLLNVGIGLVIMAVSAAVSYFSSLEDSVEATKERYEELQSTISSAEDDVNSLASELETIQEKIDALSNKQLTITEAEELRKLKEQSAELQRQKDIRESILGVYQAQDEAASLDMFNKTIQTTSANQEKDAEKAKTWGKVIGGALAAGIGAALIASGIGSSVGLTLASSGSMALIGALGYGGSAAGGHIAEKLSMDNNAAKNLEEWYASYANAISEANQQAAEAEAEYLSNLTDDNYDKWQKKLEASNTLQQELYNNLEQLQGYVDNLEYNDNTKATIDGFNSLMTKISLQGIGDDAQSQIAHIQSLEEEFNELSKGVDANGKNIALSADEYARYQSILSQILGITPSLIKGYNDEGQAIVEKNSLIQQSIDLLKKQQQIEAQNLTTPEKVYESYQAAQKNQQSLNDDVKDVALPEFVAKLPNARQVAFEAALTVGTGAYFNKEITNIEQFVDAYAGQMIANAEAIFDQLERKGFTTDEISQFATYLNELNIAVEYAKNGMLSFKQTLAIIPKSSEYYNDLSGSHIAFIDSYIDSLGDLDDLSEEEVKNIRANIFALTENIGSNEKAQDLINSLFEIDTDLAAQTYINTINSILAEIVDTGLINEDTAAAISESLVPDVDKIDTMITAVKDALIDEYDALADNLSVTELEIAYKFVADKESGSVTGEQLKEALAAKIPESLDVVSTYSELVEQTTNYNEILQQTSEYVTNNMKVTEEYKEALSGLGISAQDIAQCFDDENKLIVKNADLLNKLVKNAKNNITANTKLTKAQARLQYYELYKEMRRLTNGTKITDGATLSYVNSLYDQMTALEKTIAKYSLLEAKLLGASNAYEQLEEAQAFDSEMDYGSKAEEMVNVLAEAFNTAKLGTQAAQVAINGLIPDEVIDKTKAPDDQMQQIYDYFTKGAVSKLFTIEFDDDGGITSVEMTKENVEAFTNSLIEAGEVFHGTWDEFTLDESIISLKDFAKAIGVTEEVAFAYLTELEKFDIGWLGGDYETLLDQLMSGDVEYAINKNIQELADLEQRMANGEFDYEGGDNDYAKQYAALDKEYKANQDNAREVAAKWAEATNQIEAAQTKLEELDETDPEFSSTLTELYNAKALLNGLKKPTEIVLQVASEAVTSQIEQMESDLMSSGIVLDDIIQIDENSGVYKLLTDLTSIGTVDLQTYLDLKNEELAIKGLFDAEITTTEEYLSNIDTTVSNILSELSGETSDNPDNTTNASEQGHETFADLAEQLRQEMLKRREDDANQARREEFEARVKEEALSGGIQTDLEKLDPKTTTDIIYDYARSTLDEALRNAGLEYVDYLNKKKTEEDKENGIYLPENVIDDSALNVPSNTPKPNDATSNKTNAEINADVVEVAGEVDNQDDEIDYLALAQAMAQGNVIHNAETGAVIQADTVTVITSDGGESIPVMGTSEDEVYKFMQEHGLSIPALGKSAETESDVNTSTDVDAKLEEVLNHIAQQIQEEYKQSNVDLLNRPRVDWTDMNAAGWNTPEGSYSTVDTVTFTAGDFGLSDKDGQDYAINVTPILPDGTVIDGGTSGLWQYINDKLDNGNNLEDLDIFLGIYDTIEAAERAAQRLHELQESYYTAKDDPWAEIDMSLYEPKEAQSIYAEVELDTEEAEEKIDELGDKVTSVLTTPPDPLLLNSVNFNIDTLKNQLDQLGVKYKDTIGTWFDGKRELEINLPDLVTALQTQGWSDIAIHSYLSQLLSIDLGDYLVFTSEPLIAPISDIIDTLDNVPDDKEVSVEEIGAAETEEALKGVDDAAKDVTKTVTTEYVTEYKTIGNTGTVRSSAGGGGRYTMVNGTAHAQGTAYKSGSWGATKTETALTSELGPEIRVRDGRWELLGEHGAQFTDVKKGDIIFNHKQTEELLTNGYITGRGKAFAEGTVGGAAFAGINTWDDKYNTLSKDYSNQGDALSDAAGDLSDAADEFREVFDWIEVRLEEINERISLKGAELENKVGSSAQNAVIDDMIALNKKLYDNLTAGAAKYNSYAQKLLSKIPAEYRKAAQDGSIAIEEFVGEVDEETLNSIQEYREWVQKGADVTQQAEETLTEISNLAKQAIDNIAQDYENKTSFGNSRIEQLEAFNAFTETDLGYESASIYQAMIEENNRNIAILQDQRNAMLAELNKRVESGEIKRGSQDWYDAINEIAAVDTEIVNLKTDTENYQDAINDLHWDKFDSLINRLQSVSEEAENLIDILGNSDLVDEAGNWTDEGITSLGLYAQQMEAAEVEAKKYQDEIDYLNANWQRLGYTEEEYLERLGELKDGQYAAIQSYHKSKDAIVDMTKARVDAIKKGIEKEIEAYEELINKKKEELDAEKDLYDFQKGVASQQKNIAELQRKIAALSSDNSASARAKRAQLEAELAEAQQELADTYYDRSVSNQQEALDKELEAFNEEKDKEMEGWDEYLEDTSQVVSDCLATVQENTATVYQVLKDLGKEYGLSITESLTSPWQAGENAIDSFTEKFGDSMSATVDELRELEVEFIETMANIELAGKNAADTVKDNFKDYKDAKYTPPAEEPEEPKQDEPKQQQQIVHTVQKGDTLWAIAEKYLGSGYKWRDILNLNKDVIKNDTGIIYVGQKLKIPQYASGTTGAKNNQLAWIDELGEELVIRPSNGRMTFMEKGTGVIPADLTSNLMEWGELDPSIMLERNKPVISAPHITNNNVEIKMEIAEVVHVDRVDSNNLPDLTKAVEKQLDKYMKQLNGQIRKYAR